MKTLQLILVFAAFSASLAHAQLKPLGGLKPGATHLDLQVEEDRLVLGLEIGDEDREAFAALRNAPVGTEHAPIPIRLDGHEISFRIAEKLRARQGARNRWQMQATLNQEAPLVDYVRLVADLESPPTQLTLSPPVGESGRPSALPAYVIWHGGIPVNDIKYLAGEVVLRLDGSDPWNSKLTTDAKDQDAQRKLAAPVTGFLYVQPNEVRFEALVRLKPAQSTFGIALEETISVAQQQTMLNGVADQLGSAMSVEVNGAIQPGKLVRAQFVRPLPMGYEVIDPPEALPDYAGFVGVILSYGVEEKPDSVRLSCTLFDEAITTLPLTVIDSAGQSEHLLSATEPEVVWAFDGNNLETPKAPMVIPTPPEIQPEQRTPGMLIFVFAAVTLLCAIAAIASKKLRKPLGILAALLLCISGVLFFAATRTPSDIKTALPPDQELTTITGALLHNIYMAFDYQDEERIYDTLSHSVAGELLRETYLQIRRGLELQNQGGASVRIDRLDLQSAAFESAAEGFIATARWQAQGSVSHWGHAHQRVNVYEARLTISPVDEQWRLTDLEFIAEDRVL